MPADFVKSTGELSPYVRTKGTEPRAVFKFHDLCGVCTGNYIAGSCNSECSGSFLYARNKGERKKRQFPGGSKKKKSEDGGR